MNDFRHRIVRTLRCKNLNVPGTLGKLTSSIGKLRAEIGNITTVYLGHHYTIRDIDVLSDSHEHLELILEAVSQLDGISVIQVIDDVLELHKNGKIKMVNTSPIKTLTDLRRVYTPGVAEVCNMIKDKPIWKDAYTTIPYSIAIVTDGTAILGLGNIGSVAGMPVMEGKAALIQELAGVSGIPILLDTVDSDEIVEIVKHISLTFGGIHLEDIASPRCFYIQDRLEKELDIPVMHDDQQATAVVVLAVVINACKLSNIALEEACIGLIGLGAAGLAIGKLLLRYTGKPTLGTAKTEVSKQRHAVHGGIQSNLEEIMRKADIVIGTSGVPGLIRQEMVKKGQIILALSNPQPEILPELALESGAVIAADGKSVNNLIGFPGIWRGTLDAKAEKITNEMYREAALAIVKSTNSGELVPNCLDPNVHLAVTHAVARAAIESGVARRKLDTDYFECEDIKKFPAI
ncbi:NAD-dependent malic enzyme [Chloroflexota bacterium]